MGRGGLEKISRNSDSTLQNPYNTNTVEYRYRGVNPNNYVYFNCIDLKNQKNNTCDMWRIIGIFPTIDSSGNISNRIKLIKNETIGEFTYDTAPSNSHDWAKPVSLNTYLNSNYYNSMTSFAKDMIDSVKYFLGGYTTTTVSKEAMHNYERKTSGSNYFYSGNHTSWTGKLAIMYTSDYGYAADNSCFSLLNDYKKCLDTNWIFNNISEWVFGQYSSYYYSNFYLAYSADIGTAGVNLAQNSFNVRPVLYLSSTVQITGGAGTSNDPYQLSL